MGAFYFAASQKDVPKDVLKVFEKKGFGSPIEICLDNSVLLYYKKQLLDEPCVLRSDRLTLLAAGTCIYKGESPPGNLKAIADDYLNGRLHESDFLGNFFLMVIDRGRVRYLADVLGQYPVYYSRQAGIVSSSFLATVTGSSTRLGKLRVNRDAISEILATGNLLGPESILEGIARYIPGLESTGLPGMAQLKIVEENRRRSERDSQNGDGLLSRQIDVFDQHFSAYASAFQIYGATSGLTGGLDSRLLFLILRRHFENLQLYMNTYNPESIECSLARAFASEAEADFKCRTSRRPRDISDQEMRRILSDGFYFWDGVTRLHHLWIEERKSRDYLKRIYGNSRLGLSGVGGERFRNEDGLISKSYPFNSWIRHEILRDNSGKVISSRDEENRLVNRLKDKIANYLGMKSGSRRILRSQIRAYNSRYFNTTNRTLRNAAENQLCYFLSPFVEPSVSILPDWKLGSHMEVELELIRILGPELEQMPTSYGFSPADGPSLAARFMPIVKQKHLLPVFHRFRALLSGRYGDDLRVLLDAHAFLGQYLQKVKELDLPIDLDLIQRNNYLSPLLLEIGYFLSEMEEFVASG